MTEDETIKNILEKYETVAVVGLSRNSAKDSYRVAKFLLSKGYDIIPINPSADKILDRRCYKTLLDLPEDVKKKIEIVDIFRRSKDVPQIVGQAIQLRKKHGKPHVIWMQLGIVNEKAAKRASEAGLQVVIDRCMMREYRRLNSRKESVE